MGLGKPSIGPALAALPARKPVGTVRRVLKDRLHKLAQTIHDIRHPVPAEV